MKFHTTDPSAGPGVYRGELTFENPVLAGYRWPCVEVRGTAPGPRLCITAGVHVNEVAGIEAAVRLQACFMPDHLCGSVSIIPIVNLPAMRHYTQYNCPLDGKNINFTFPGQSDGTFSEALCHALLFDWASDADLYIDLHGGDLRENVAHFIMFQRSGDAGRDNARESLARCFDADLVVGFAPKHTEKPGRAITALARYGRDGVMSEAGANGLVDEAAVQFHMDGVINIARRLGMIEGPESRPRRPQVLCRDYLWIPCPADGLLRLFVAPGHRVSRNQRLGSVESVFGEPLGDLAAPAGGHVLWVVTHPLVSAHDLVVGLGCEGEEDA